MATTKAAAYTKEWRKRKMQEDPEFLERERAEARERARAKWEAKKNDPEYLDRERVRKRALANKRRADPVKGPKILAQKTLIAARPDQKEKQKQRLKKWKAEKADHVQTYQKQWRDKNIEAVKAYGAEYMKGYVKTEAYTVGRTKRRFKTYNITALEFNSMWEGQKGCCAICQTKLEPRGRSKNSAAIDHNHKTREVRGILCRGCNHGIGTLGDNPSTLIAAAEYLMKKGYYGKNRNDINA
jgi:hypothetical protein